MTGSQILLVSEGVQRVTSHVVNELQVSTLVFAKSQVC